MNNITEYIIGFLLYDFIKIAVRYYFLTRKPKFYGVPKMKNPPPPPEKESK